MTRQTEERELEHRLRSALSSWAEEAPRGSSPWVAPAGLARGTMRRSWAARLAPVGVAAASVVGLAVWAIRSPDSETTVVTSQPDLVRTEVAVGEALGVRVLALGDGALYVASENDRRLFRVDTASHDVLAGPELAVPDGVAVSRAGVIAVIGSADRPPRLARLDPVTLSVEVAVDPPQDTAAVAAVGDEVWVRTAGGEGRRFDGTSLHDEGALPVALAPGFQDEGPAGLWRSDLDSGDVLRLDPASGEVVAEIDIDGEARGVAVGDGAVWVGDVANDRVLRLDPTTGHVDASIPTGRFPNGLALGDGRLWVTNFEDGTLTVIDTARGAALTTVPIGVRPGSVVLDGGALWVSVHQEGVVREVDPAELESRSIRPIDEQELDVDLGTRTLFVRCMGRAAPGVPTVVLEAGGGMWSEHELFIQYGLQSTHRVCAYDRAGLGRSDSRPGPRTAQRIANDLHRALGVARIPGPYVLVGHNFGGLYARLFAAQHPDEVAGLVLVDAVSTTWLDELAQLLDADERAAFEAGFDDPEFANFDESAAEVEAAGDLGDLPLVVVAGQDTLRDRGEAVADLWQRHQRALLELSAGSRLVVAEGADAVFPTDAPEVVVEAVRSLGES